MHKRLRFLTLSAMIAALYVLLTELSALFGMSSGAIQLRLSEALCVLPCFTTAAIPGLFVGCLLANLLTTATIWDITLGSFATLLGALGTYALRKWRWLSPLPPILANTCIIPFVIALSFGEVLSAPLLLGYALTVGIGEVISCGVFGMMLFPILEKYKSKLF